jgi:hypothetical protein
MMPPFVIAPFAALEGTEMKRVSQFHLYSLGIVRALSHIKTGARLANYEQQLLLASITLTGFWHNELNETLIPGSVAAAKHAMNVFDMLHKTIYGQYGLARYTDEDGNVTDAAQELISHVISKLDTILEHELRELPTYVIEKVGIYDTDDLLTKADTMFVANLVPHIPAKSLGDVKKAGSCLGFELHTASGFHGYRAVDEMLRAYCTHFTGGLPRQKDWGSFIQAVRNMPAGSARMPNSRTIELIDRIRAEDRNPLIHPETDLDADEARNAFDLCRTAITFMAQDIKNAP